MGFISLCAKLHKTHALQFHEALHWLLNPIGNKFTISLGSIWIYDDSSFFTDHASSPCLPFPPRFSLAISKKKNSRNKSQEVFQMKTSTCRDGTFKNQPNKMGTPQYIHTIPTSCAIFPTMHNKKLFTQSLNEPNTQQCSLYSLPHKRQSRSATFSSNKIHNRTWTPNIP